MVADQEGSHLAGSLSDSTPAVTVVIPTRNRRRLLLRTLDSVLRQDDVPFDVVIVDDGGTDGTSEAVEELCLPNVRVLRHERSKGVSAARNAGLQLVAAPWVAFVDDDDLWAPAKLRGHLTALEQRPAARWSCVDAIHVDDRLRPLWHAAAPRSGDISDAMLQSAAVPGGGSGVLTDTNLAREIGGFDENLSIIEWRPPEWCSTGPVRASI
jgi:glycosyltransferase involved in cell wall biosynthesis